MEKDKYFQTSMKIMMKKEKRENAANEKYINENFHFFFLFYLAVYFSRSSVEITKYTL
jgi:hypothetical protein